MEEDESETPIKKKPATKSLRARDKADEKGKSSGGKKQSKKQSQSLTDEKLAPPSGETDIADGKENAPLDNGKPCSQKAIKASTKDKSLKKDDASDDASSSTNEKASSSRPFSHWLFKSEPDTRLENGIDMKFGFDDLKQEPDGIACWDGVRNYQARNFMKDQMRVGDKAFFYHSNTKPPGVIGLIDVVKESYVDHTQFDRKDPHFDPKATKENPKWFMVDVKYNRPLNRYIPLEELKALHLEHKKNGGPLKDLALFTKARLSVQPLTEHEFNFILGLEDD